MPSGPSEWHAIWCSRDPQGNGDLAAIAYLKAQGYALTGRWEWRLPKPEHWPTPEENFAIDYLIAEWDFGGIEPERDRCRREDDR